MFDNCVAIAAGKGGVLKTSLSSNLAGVAASNGWNVLLVDADPQGNVMFDLGFNSDGGEALSSSLVDGTRLVPLRDVRSNLDVVCGGPALDRAASCFSSDPGDWSALAHALEPLAQAYDLIVIDSPARELWLRRQILTAARFVVVPSGIDRASRVGMPGAAMTIREVRNATNPRLDVLGVVAGPIAVTSTRIRARARQRLGELIGDHDLVCGTVIRHAPLVAEQCRELGLLAHEYAASFGRRSIDSGDGSDPARRSSAADGVAADWSALAAELLARYCAARYAPASPAEGMAAS